MREEADIGAPKMSVENLTRADRPSLRQHFEVCWLEHYGSLFDQSVAEAMITALDSNDVAGLLPQTDQIGLCIRSEGKIVATCIGAKRQSVGYIWGCYVQPAHQRKGMGRILLQAMEARLCADSLVVIVLDACAGARDFYRAQGFEAKERTEYEIVPRRRELAHVMTVPTEAFRATALDAGAQTER